MADPARSLSPPLAALLLAGAALACLLPACASIRPGAGAAHDPPAAPGLATFLMFEGEAEEALGFYVSLFDDAEVLVIERFGPGEQGALGSVKLARFRLHGHDLMCFDSPAPHAFGFTPSISLFVTCGTEAELDRLHAALGRDGEELMPPKNYGFSRKFTWIADRFGVSWQLNLPALE